MATPVLAPLVALHRPGDPVQKLRRTVEQIANPAGLYAAIPKSDFPVGEHELDLLLMDDDEINDFWNFYDTILGALVPFWVPSYQEDFLPMEPIGSADTEFTFESIGYTDQMFDDPNRIDIVFIRTNGTWLKRTIINATNNLDGTETVELNASLGEIWTPGPTNGVSFCWYVRLAEDPVEAAYSNNNVGEVQLRVIEDKEPPSGSGTETAMP